MKNIKASEKIQKLAQEFHERGTDPGFNGNVPDIADFINAIIQYLDNQNAKTKSKT